MTPFLADLAIGLFFYDFTSLQRRVECECSGFARPAAGLLICDLFTTTKMFNYHAAEVPVVGMDIPCMAPVKDQGAGNLLTELSGVGIAGAVNAISVKSEEYSRAAFRAAEAYDCGRHAQSLLDGYLMSPRVLSRDYPVVELLCCSSTPREFRRTTPGRPKKAIARIGYERGSFTRARHVPGPGERERVT